MKKVLLLFLFNIPIIGFAQSNSGNKSDSLHTIPGDNPSQINLIYDSANHQKSLLHFNSYFSLLGKNLKDGFTKPFHLSKKDWVNFGKYAAVTFALSFADEPVQQAALRLRNRNTGLNNLSKGVSNFGGIYEVFAVAGIGAYGLISKNNKLANTALLSSQAYITSGAITIVLKFLSGRTRPSYYPPGVEAEPKFLVPFHKNLNDANGSKENSSFPSGHATVTFAVATVFATEYKDKPLVPVVAYSAASLISISRITENKHWITDVFTGAAIGYLSGKLAIKNFHRFQKDSSSERKKNSISFSVNYNWDHIEPCLIYQFR
ncbi:MAG TPA: phosphatase PAP2 family protein [Hanamia sp.]|nr:phosphatase PAP2 family protein [Hanamia sp.]